MELKLGHKRTEVGVIPVDWHVTPLASVADKIMVGIASAATHAYRSKGIPMFRNQNIKPGRLDDDDLLFIAPEYEAAYRNKRLRAGDLLTMRTGYPGVTALVPEEYGQAQSFTTLITRPNKSSIEPLYLCYYINSELGKKFFIQSQIGGAQKNVNAGTLRGMPLGLPSTLIEQTAIATALCDVDALLSGLDKLIAKKRDLKRAAMQQLLTGKTRLPGFGGERSTKQTGVGVIPVDWMARTLGEIGESLIGLTYDLSEVREFGTLVLRSSNIQCDALAFDDNVYVDTNVPERIMVRAGDVLICVRNGSRDLIGKSAFLDDRVEGMTFGAFMAVHRGPYGRWVSFLLQSDILKRQINEHLGATINQITNKSLNSFHVPLPSDEREQLAIVEVLSDMDAELTALEVRREKTRLLKQGMMQELLTGKTRLI